MVIVWIIGILWFFYILRKHTIKGTDWAIPSEEGKSGIIAMIFSLGLTPIINLLFALYLTLELCNFKNKRKWWEIILFIPKKDGSR